MTASIFTFIATIGDRRKGDNLPVQFTVTIFNLFLPPREWQPNLSGDRAKFTLHANNWPWSWKWFTRLIFFFFDSAFFKLKSVFTRGSLLRNNFAPEYQTITCLRYSTKGELTVKIVLFIPGRRRRWQGELWTWARMNSLIEDLWDMRWDESYFPCNLPHETRHDSL